MSEIIQNPGAIPRLAMINDITGFGRCSTTVALPVVSVMQIQACPVPTSILSNHLGFSQCYFHDYTPYMRDYLKGFQALSLYFDGISCGFLGNEEQIAIIENFLDQTLTEHVDTLFILDPVLGDHGKTYSTITPQHCRRMQSLVRRADILTPNITEACILTDTPYKEKGWQEQELADICEKLSGGIPKNIVITGLHTRSSFSNFIWESGRTSTYTSAEAGASRPGTGDLFASIIAADALKQVSFADSVKKAADFVALCIRGTEEAGVPLNEGVLFEKYLSELLN